MIKFKGSGNILFNYTIHLYLYRVGLDIFFIPMNSTQIKNFLSITCSVWSIIFEKTNPNKMCTII